MNNVENKGNYIDGNGEEYLNEILKETDSCYIRNINFVIDDKTKDPLLKEFYKYSKNISSDSTMIFVSYKAKENLKISDLVHNLFKSIYGIAINIFYKLEDTLSWGSVYAYDLPITAYFGKKDDRGIEHLILIIPHQFDNELIDSRIENLKEDLFIARLKGGLRDVEIYE